MNWRQNKSGVVMVIVLMIVMVIMIFSVTILSQSINQNSFSQDQVDQIKAEQLAKGMFWNSFASGDFSQRTINLGIIDGKSYTANVTATGAGPGSTQGYSFQVSY